MDGSLGQEAPGAKTLVELGNTTAMKNQIPASTVVHAGLINLRSIQERGRCAARACFDLPRRIACSEIIRIAAPSVKLKAWPNGLDDNDHDCD